MKFEQRTLTAKQNIPNVSGLKDKVNKMTIIAKVKLLKTVCPEYITDPLTVIHFTEKGKIGVR